MTSGSTADSVRAVTRVIAFDVNETLLDLSVLDELLGGAEARARWFGQMLQIAFVGAITDRYVDFTTAQRAALTMLGHDQNADAVIERMKHLPPHPDAALALDRLRDSGHQLAALTNSTLEVARAQLQNAGLADRFHAILSADQVRALKPRPEPYHLVARHFDTEPADVRLVAAHAWDISGALAAGCKAAFVRRPGKALTPVGDQPDIAGDDLRAVADEIAAQALG
jgi:2-haloacid dehalogenase